jgi:hypothetical protein
MENRAFLISNNWNNMGSEERVIFSFTTGDFDRLQRIPDWRQGPFRNSITQAVAGRRGRHFPVRSFLAVKKNYLSR